MVILLFYAEIIKSVEKYITTFYMHSQKCKNRILFIPIDKIVIKPKFIGSDVIIINYIYKTDTYNTLKSKFVKAITKYKNIKSVGILTASSQDAISFTASDKVDINTKYDSNNINVLHLESFIHFMYTLLLLSNNKKGLIQLDIIASNAITNTSKDMLSTISNNTKMIINTSRNIIRNFNCVLDYSTRYIDGYTNRSLIGRYFTVNIKKMSGSLSIVDIANNSSNIWYDKLVSIFESTTANLGDFADPIKLIRAFVSAISLMFTFYKLNKSHKIKTLESHGKVETTLPDFGVPSSLDGGDLEKLDDLAEELVSSFFEDIQEEQIEDYVTLSETPDELKREEQIGLFNINNRPARINPYALSTYAPITKYIMEHINKGLISSFEPLTAEKISNILIYCFTIFELVNNIDTVVNIISAIGKLSPKNMYYNKELGDSEKSDIEKHRLSFINTIVELATKPYVIGGGIGVLLILLAKRLYTTWNTDTYTYIGFLNPFPPEEQERPEQEQ